jgi:hypothetical protein
MRLKRPRRNLGTGPPKQPAFRSGLKLHADNCQFGTRPPISKLIHAPYSNTCDLGPFGHAICTYLCTEV